MRTHRRLPIRSALAVVGWLGSIGWAVNSSFAQVSVWHQPAIDLPSVSSIMSAEEKGRQPSQIAAPNGDQRRPSTRAQNRLGPTRLPTDATTATLPGAVPGPVPGETTTPTALTAGAPTARPDGSDPNQPTYNITLSEALQRTLQESTEIQVGQQDIAIAVEEVEIAKSVFDPTFYWMYNQGYGSHPSPDLTTRPNDNHATANSEFHLLKRTLRGTRLDLSTEWLHAYDQGGDQLINPWDESKLNLSITQPLLRGAGLALNTAPIILASRFTEITALRFERIVTQVMRETEVVFWEFHFRFENWRDELRTYETAKKLQELAQAEYDVGLYSELEFQRAQSELAQRMIKLTEARTAATVTENKLKAITNAEFSRHGPTIKWQPNEMTLILKPHFVIEEEICRGFDNRHDFQAAVADLQKQNIHVDVSENALLPIIDLEMGLSSGAISGRDAGHVDQNGNRLISPYVGDLGDLIDDIFSSDGVVWNVGVIVKFPFYRREAAAVVRQRQAEAKQALDRLVYVERSIIREVREAIEIIQTTYLKVEQSKQNREYAEAIYDKTLFQMQNGMTDIKRVVDALDNVAEARILENKVVAEYLNALSQLEQATGTYLANRGVYLDPMGYLRSPLSHIQYTAHSGPSRADASPAERLGPTPPLEFPPKEAGETSRFGYKRLISALSGQLIPPKTN